MSVLEFCRAFGQSTLKEVEMGSKENRRSGPDRSNSRQNTASGLCHGIFDDLKSGRHVKDEVILHCVEDFVNSGESASAVQFIPDLQPLLSDRPQLRGRMLAREGSIWLSSDDFKGAAASFQPSLEILEAVHLKVDLQWLSSLVQTGESLLSLGRKREAEAHFLQALSYPWYTAFAHPTEMQSLRDQYIFLPEEV